jgi:hypothetical protein
MARMFRLQRVGIPSTTIRQLNWRAYARCVLRKLLTNTLGHEWGEVYSRWVCSSPVRGVILLHPYKEVHVECNRCHYHYSYLTSDSGVPDEKEELKALLQAFIKPPADS